MASIHIRSGSFTWKAQSGEISVGKGGLKSPEKKEEGDGATPTGTYHILWGYYRADRLDPPTCGLPLYPITPSDGWCDDPDDTAYNLPVTLPYAARHEKMWREDSVYDVVLVTTHNAMPVIPGKGSAVFIHCRPEGGRPTEGCIGIPQRELLHVVSQLEPGASIEITA